MTTDRTTMHPDVERLHHSLLLQEDRLTEIRSAIDELADRHDEAALRRAIVGALTQIMADRSEDGPLQQFLHHVYGQMMQHAGKSASQAVGQRVIGIIGAAVLACGVYLSAKMGVLK